MNSEIPKIGSTTESGSESGSEFLLDIVENQKFLHEQNKNIQKVFKLSPKLEQAVYNVLGQEYEKDIEIEPDTEESVYPEPQGLFHRINIFYKGELVTNPDGSDDVDGQLSIRTRKDGTSYINIFQLPTKLQNQGLGIKILQKVANTLDTKITPAFLGDGDTTSEQARNMWKKVNNEISPNHEAENLYGSYIETIFPESKIKEVIWHGTASEENFENFDIDRGSSFGFEKHGAIFFTSSFEDARIRGSGDINKKAERIIPVVANIKNPLVSGEKNEEKIYDDIVAEGKEKIAEVLSMKDIKKKWEENGWKYRIEGDKLIIAKVIKHRRIGLFDSNNNLVTDLSHNMGVIGNIKENQVKEWKEKGFDGIIDNTDIAKLSGLRGDKRWIVVFNPEDSHILGSERDINDFKNWIIEKQSVKTRQ